MASNYVLFVNTVTLLLKFWHSKYLQNWYSPQSKIRIKFIIIYYCAFKSHFISFELTINTFSKCVVLHYTWSEHLTICGTINGKYDKNLCHNSFATSWRAILKASVIKRGWNLSKPHYISLFSSILSIWEIEHNCLKAEKSVGKTM